MPLPRDQSAQPRLVRGVFLLLGPSGSGKGSVGAALLQRGAITAHASIGAWLREVSSEPTALEPDLMPLQPLAFATPLEYLRHAVTSGLLIPDQWTQAVLEQRLKVALISRWALDGYPRTIGAAQHLVSALTAIGIPLLGAIHLRISDEVATRRLLARGRTDDASAAIAQRLEFYRSSVIPTLEWLQQRGICVADIAASPTLESVVSEVERVLEGWRQKRGREARAARVSNDKVFGLEAEFQA